MKAEILAKGAFGRRAGSSLLVYRLRFVLHTRRRFYCTSSTPDNISPGRCCINCTRFIMPACVEAQESSTTPSVKRTVSFGELVQELGALPRLKARPSSIGDYAQSQQAFAV